MLDGVLFLFLGKQQLFLDDSGGPLEGPVLVRLVRANPLIWADSAGLTGWEVLKMALVTVLVEVERVITDDTVVHLE